MLENINSFIEEIFLPISGIKGSEVLSKKYRISNYGKIFNIIDYKFVKLSLCGDPKYYYVTLTHKGVRGTYRVHRLVGFSFISNPLNLPILDHIDRDKLNNYTDNLRWVTNSQNQYNSDRGDNKGNNSNKKCRNVKFKGVHKNRVSFRCKDYGEYRDEITSAKIFDVIAFHYLKDSVLNFPNEKLLCEYKDIMSYRINKAPIQKGVHKHIVERIKYLWKYEYVTKKSLIKKYKISSCKLRSILCDLSPKVIKPMYKMNNIGVKRIYLRRCIREKYLSGEHSRKKIVEDLVFLGATPKIVDYDLIGYDIYKKKTLSKYRRKEIYNYYCNGNSFMDCVRKFDISKSMMRNIRGGLVSF